ncbi:MAG: fibronectin type III domain-containing protein [bacterium]|nr:fibronectin type III domain-containing protein [bacterium]
MSQTTVRTVRKEPPSAPSLRLSLHQDGRHCNIDWSPGTGGGAATSFEVEVNRPLPAPSWQSDTLSFESEKLSTKHCGRGVGTDYYVTVRAKNEYGTSAGTSHSITIPGPRLTIEYHGWDAGPFDSDAKISWDPVWGENAEYQLDWRYINKNEKVVDHLKIDKKSKPNNSDKPEIVYKWGYKEGFWSNYTGRLYKDLREKNPKFEKCDVGLKIWDSDPCNPEPKDNIEVKIKEVERDYVLQVRVGDSSGARWTPWYYHPAAYLDVKCTNYRIFNKIKKTLKTVESIDTILTAGGIALALFTAGSSAVASVGIKEAAKRFAVQLVNKMLKEKVIKKYFRDILEDILEDTLKNITANSSVKIAEFALVAACVVQAQNGNDESFEIEVASQLVQQIVSDPDVVGDDVVGESSRGAVIDAILNELKNI